MRTIVFATFLLTTVLFASATPVENETKNNSPVVRSRARRQASGIPHIDEFEKIKQCIPGSNFYDRCNLCRCTDGENADCSKNVCDSQYETPHIDEWQDGKKCYPDRLFMKDCNPCICGSNGISAGCKSDVC